MQRHLSSLGDRQWLGRRVCHSALTRCRLETDAAEDASKKKALLKALHARARDLKSELRERLSAHASEMAMKPVRRDYAFDDARVPRGRQWVLKVTCNAAPGAVPAGVVGSHFAAVLGTTQSPLEALLLKRKVMGPSWLRIRGAVVVQSQAQVSWCKVRVAYSPAVTRHVAEPAVRLRCTAPHAPVARTRRRSCAKHCEVWPLLFDGLDASLQSASVCETACARTTVRPSG